MTAPTTEMAGIELEMLLPKESVYVYVMVVKMMEAEDVPVLPPPPM